MQPVIQLEPTGCGIACVAMLTGKTYRQTQVLARALGIRASDPALWSGTSYVRQLLRHCGMSTAAREAPFRSWKQLPDVSLLAIKWHLERGTPFWHWVVFVRDNSGAYVIDPKCGLRNNRRTDFGRIRPKWYIAVRSAV